MQTTINFILHNRYKYFRFTINELLKLDKQIKKIINLNIFISLEDQIFWEPIIAKIKKFHINVDVFLVNNQNNYMNKISHALQNSKEYIILVDEDIFIPKNTWEFFITNLNCLENKKNFFDKKEKNIIEKMFIKTHIPSIWGVNYENLNENTTQSLFWDAENFYNNVSKIKHHYLGVHPVRFSFEAQQFINDFCINKFSKLCSASDFSLIEMKRPYFCNSVFGIKRNTWFDVLNDKALFYDEFDEVPLNLYMKNNNLNMVFIKGSVAFHPSYNTINIYNYNYQFLSDKFFNDKVIK